MTKLDIPFIEGDDEDKAQAVLFGDWSGIDAERPTGGPVPLFGGKGVGALSGARAFVAGNAAIAGSTRPDVVTDAGEGLYNAGGETADVLDLPGFDSDENGGDMFGLKAVMGFGLLIAVVVALGQLFTVNIGDIDD